MKRNIRLLVASIWQVVPAFCEEEIRFTSVPDIYNRNIRNPQPGWEEAMDWFFKRLKKRGRILTLMPAAGAAAAKSLHFVLAHYEKGGHMGQLWKPEVYKAISDVIRRK